MRFNQFFLACLTLPLAAAGDCGAFRAELVKTYAFRPSQLSADALTIKSKEMDRIWKQVNADHSLIPCLEQAIEDPAATQSLRYDGSALLVHSDPSHAHKAMQAKWWGRTELVNSDARAWVETLAALGAEGYDTREGALRWLATKDPHYFLPEHGGWEIDQATGAAFLFGSMDEGQAFDALKGVIEDPKNPAKELAAETMLGLGTPASCAYIRTMDLSGVNEEYREVIGSLRRDHQLIKPRSGRPKVSREAFLAAFHAFVDKGNLDPFMALAGKVSDGERDAVMVLRPEDLPLLHSFRRHLFARCNPHLLEWDKDLEFILITLSWPAGA